MDLEKITNGPAYFGSNITDDTVRSLYKFSKEPATH